MSRCLNGMRLNIIEQGRTSTGVLEQCLHWCGCWTALSWWRACWAKRQSGWCTSQSALQSSPMTATYGSWLKEWDHECKMQKAGLNLRIGWGEVRCSCCSTSLKGVSWECVGIWSGRCSLFPALSNPSWVWLFFLFNGCTPPAGLGWEIGSKWSFKCNLLVSLARLLSLNWLCMYELD